MTYEVFKNFVSLLFTKKGGLMNDFLNKCTGFCLA